MVRVDDHFVWSEPTADDAFTLEWDEHLFTCPRFPRLRMLEGVVAFNNAHPGTMLVDEPTAQRAADELAEIRTSTPDARSYILSSPWHVPLRWFSAFSQDQREIYEAVTGTSIRYRTYVRTAAERVQWSVAVLDEAGFDDAIVDQVRGLEQWLSEFTADAMLELDYAGVGALFSEGELAMDESALEVESSLQALERGNFEEAGEFYMAVAGRWAPAQALIYAN